MSEPLWKSGVWRIEWYDDDKHWRGFGIANGVNMYHYSCRLDVFDFPERIPPSVKARARELARDRWDEFEDPA